MSYKRYYRKSGWRRVLSIAAVVIVVIAVLASAYWIFDNATANSDGTYSLRFPFIRQSAVSPSYVPPPDPSAIVLPPPSEEAPPSPSPSEEALPSPSAPPFVPVSVTIDILTDEEKFLSFQDYIDEAGATHIIVDWKDTAGNVLSGELWQSVKLILGDDYYYIARIEAFRDNNMTRKHSSWGIKHTSGVNWIDKDQNRWLNPFVEKSVKYVLECIAAAGDAGFDEIYLTGLGFPNTGKTDQIGYGANAQKSHTETINAFLQRVSALEVACPLSAYIYPETALTGEETVSGQSLSAFTETFTALYTVYDGAPEDLPEGVLPAYAELVL